MVHPQCARAHMGAAEIAGALCGGPHRREFGSDVSGGGTEGTKELRVCVCVCVRVCVCVVGRVVGAFGCRWDWVEDRGRQEHSSRTAL